MKRFTFKDHAKPTGLMKVAAGPLGCDLKLDGKVVGGVNAGRASMDINDGWRWTSWLTLPDGTDKKWRWKPSMQERDTAKNHLLAEARKAYGI